MVIKIKHFEYGELVSTDGEVEGIVSSIAVLTGSEAQLVRKLGDLYLIRSGRVVYVYNIKKGLCGTYASVGPFREGLSVVRNKDALKGYIDLSGSLVIEPEYLVAFAFKNGRAIVGNGVSRGAIDKTGNIVIPLVYQAITFNGDVFKATPMFSSKIETLDINGALIS